MKATLLNSHYLYDLSSTFLSAFLESCVDVHFKNHLLVYIAIYGALRMRQLPERACIITRDYLLLCDMRERVRRACKLTWPRPLNHTHTVPTMLVNVIGCAILGDTRVGRKEPG